MRSQSRCFHSESPQYSSGLSRIAQCHRNLLLRWLNRPARAWNSLPHDSLVTEIAFIAANLVVIRRRCCCGKLAFIEKRQDLFCSMGFCISAIDLFLFLYFFPVQSTSVGAGSNLRMVRKSCGSGEATLGERIRHTTSTMCSAVELLLLSVSTREQ